jgi:hypothetical protein
MAPLQNNGEKTMSNVKLSDIPLTAIANVVDYLEHDEEQHYLEYEEERGRTHIVHSVRRLKKFLYAVDPNNPLERIYAQQAKRWEREMREWRKLEANNQNQA